jgi:hypothetical protein
MKFIALLSLILLASCSVLKDYSTDGFKIQGNQVLYNGVVMAELTALEFALDNNKIVKEMSFKILDDTNNDKIYNLISFLNKEHPDYEIEINIPFEHTEGLREN